MTLTVDNAGPWSLLFRRHASLLAGAALSSSAEKSIGDFLDHLKAANAQVNVISFSSDEELFVNHAVDALAALAAPCLSGREAARAVDVGTGGGFPGMPLFLARPGWSMTFLDSVRKKQAVLAAFLESRGLSRGLALWDRAETAGRDPAHRETYDLSFCRAVGALPLVLELALPFVKPGGLCVFHRGAEGPREVQGAESVLKTLGGRFREAFPYRLPGLDRDRHLICIEKNDRISDAYPRRPGMAAKRPLK